MLLRFAGLRAFRVLRPLRSLTVVPGMRSLVQSLLNAIPGLLNVMALLLFVFFVWGVLALQLFLGVLHPRWVWSHSALMRLRVCGRCCRKV